MANNPPNPFDNVANIETQTPSDPLAVIRQLAQALRNGVFHGSAVRISVVPGHTVNMGQQYRFCVQLPGDSDGPAYTDTLFRFYVPVDSYPTVVDFMGEGERSCANREELTRTLQELMSLSNMRARLSSLNTLSRENLA